MILWRVASPQVKPATGGKTCAHGMCLAVSLGQWEGSRSAAHSSCQGGPQVIHGGHDGVDPVKNAGPVAVVQMLTKQLGDLVLRNTLHVEQVRGSKDTTATLMD